MKTIMSSAAMGAFISSEAWNCLVSLVSCLVKSFIRKIPKAAATNRKTKSKPTVKNGDKLVDCIRIEIFAMKMADKGIPIIAMPP